MRDELSKRIFAKDKKRTFRLYVNEPNPACDFIPPEDNLNLLFTVPITKEESKSSESALRRDFAPFILNVDNSKCNREFKVCQIGRKYYFQTIYHVYNYEYGFELYRELRKNYFD